MVSKLGDCDNINSREFKLDTHKQKVSKSFIEKRGSLSDLGKIDLINQKQKIDRGNDFATEKILKTKHDRAVSEGTKEKTISMLVPELPWKTY